MRFRRTRGFKRGLLQGISPLPTMITLGNLLCGFGAITLAVKSMRPAEEMGAWVPADLIYWGAMCVIGAMVCDGLDGHVARWTGGTSKFGLEMDSLADLCSFGLAPAVLAMSVFAQAGAAFNLPGRYVWVMLATYVSCVALRLARFNVESGPEHADHFSGLPSPAAAGCVASLLILNYSERYRGLFGAVMTGMPLLMLLLGVLMVTRVRYVHLSERLLRGKKSLMHLTILLLGLTLIVMIHEILLAAGFNLYMLSGLASELRGAGQPAGEPAAGATGAAGPAIIQVTPMATGGTGASDEAGAAGQPPAPDRQAPPSSGNPPQTT